MPFPTVDGISAQQNLEALREIVQSLPGIGHVRAKDGRVLHEVMDSLFQQVDVVSTQLYDDVQELKRVVNDLSAPALPFPSHDPSQAPIG